MPALEMVDPLPPLGPWTHRAWILTTPRSGSTWLCEMLNRAVGLPNGPHHWFPEQVNRWIWCEHAQRGVDVCHTVVGKVMAEQLQQAGITPEHRPHRAIYLIREDEAAQAASQYCLAKRGAPATVRDEPAAALVRAIGIEWHEPTAHHYLGRVRLENHYLRTAWVTSDVLTVRYEDLCSDPFAGLARIMDYLDVSRYDPRPNIRTTQRIGSPPEIVEGMRRLLVMHETGEY